MAGLSQSLESVLGGSRPRGQAGGAFRVDQHGRLMPPAAHSVMTQQDPRRFSEASITPPPRPPLPNLKRLNVKAQRKPIILPAQGPPWPSPQMLLSPPAQTQPQHQFSAPQGASGSNLVKMAQMARSTPQLDDNSRERERPREKTHYAQNTKDSFVAQVMEAVHGVTIEEVQSALQRNEWNPVRAEQQLKVEQLYLLSLCNKEDCFKILSIHQWDLQQASRYLIRLSRDDRPGPSDRPQISAERRV